MFNISLYQFNKKPNSTAVPSGTGTTYQCLAKSVTSLLNPVVDIHTNDLSIPQYNYAYIADFGRYYFIDDVAWNQGIWMLTMHVDVLASFKSDIIASSQYVLRSASSYDGNIPDELYPAKNEFTATKNNVATVTDPDNSASYPNYFTSAFSSGVFVLGIISDNNSGITYYRFTYAAFGTFLSTLMATVPSDFTDVSNGVAKSLFDPLQYIVSCQWYSIDMNPDVGVIVSSIQFGGYSIDVSGLSVGRYSSTRGKHLTTYAEIPVHPQAASRPYVKMPPYTEYVLNFEPFGLIPIDPAKVYETDRIALDWYVDIATGEAVLYVRTRAGHLITTAVSNIAVNVPITQITVDYLNAASSAVGGIVGAVGSAIFGDIGGAISSVTSGVGNTAKALAPQVRTSGVPGSFVSYLAGTPSLNAFFTDQVDIDADRYGRPLCQIKVLNTLTGYCMTSQAVIDYTVGHPTSEEAQQIADLLDGGFYLE